MVDISIEVNEINVVSVESIKGYLSLSVKAQVEGRAETVKNSKCTIEDRQNWRSNTAYNSLHIDCIGFML